MSPSIHLGHPIGYTFLLRHVAAFDVGHLHRAGLQKHVEEFKFELKYNI